MNKLLPFEEKQRHGYIDHKGNVVIPFKYKNAMFFSEGLAPVLTEDDKWGYINKEGKIVVPVQWTLASNLSDGTAYVFDVMNMVSGYIDRTGRFFNPSHPLKISADAVEALFLEDDDEEEY